MKEWRLDLSKKLSTKMYSTVWSPGPVDVTTHAKQRKMALKPASQPAHQPRRTSERDQREYRRGGGRV